MILIYILLIFTNYTENEYIEKIYDAPNKKHIEKIYNEAMKKYPKSYLINLNTAYRFLKLKDYKKAYKLYKKAYKTYPSLNALLGLTYTQTELKKFSELLEYTSKYKYKNKKDEKWLFLRRSFAFIKLKKYKKAVIEANKGLKLYPDFKMLAKNKNFAKSKLLNFSFGFFPFGGIISYKNSKIKKDYVFSGTNIFFRYKYLFTDITYTRGIINFTDKSETENNFDIGIGYTKNLNLYLHIKKIFSEQKNLLNPYLKIGYNFKNFSFFTYFSSSLYEYLNSSVYQTGIYASISFLKGKIIPQAGFSYKYFKDDKNINSTVYDFILTLNAIRYLSFQTSFTYGQKYYFTYPGGFTDNSADDINLSFRNSLFFIFGKFSSIISFSYFSLNEYDKTYRKEKISKYMLSLLLGYKF